MSNKLLAKVALIILMAPFIASQSHAFPATDVKLKDESCPPAPHEDVSQFFAPHDVNSFMFKRTIGDNPSSEINISLRYYFKSQSTLVNEGQTEQEKRCQPKKYERATFLGFNPFFSYTGKYDFYWLPVRDTRPSAPVISRYQNPAIHLRFQQSDKEDWYDIGVEHISNGQALTAKDNRALILNAYQTNNNAVMDSISRAGATVALTFEASKSLFGNSELAIKWYAIRSGQEADVFWGRFANRSVDFNNFQRFKIQWRTKYYGFNFTELPWQFGAEMSIGSLGLSEDSWNFMLNTPFSLGSFQIPLAFTAHRGPMNNMSDYTRPQNTIAAGFTFAY